MSQFFVAEITMAYIYIKHIKGYLRGRREHRWGTKPQDTPESKVRPK